MLSILSFLKGLWPRRKRPAVAPAPAPEPVAPAPPPAAEELLDDADPDDLDEPVEDETDEEDDAAFGPDPFISADRAAPPEPWAGPVEQLRADARRLALSGTHRISLTDPGGPGSLAEALNALVTEGRVQTEFHDGEGDDPPYILYRPS